jgi:hypothetical protein
VARPQLDDGGDVSWEKEIAEMKALIDELE